VCDEHQTKWPTPPNSFLSWQGQHFSQWKQNEIEISGYRPVTPLPWNTSRDKDAPPRVKDELKLVTLMIEALLADDDELHEHHARAYANAVAGTWPDRIGTGDALSLFLTAITKAWAIKGGRYGQRS